VTPARRTELTGALGVASQMFVTGTDLCEVMVGVDGEEHGGAFLV